MATRTYTVGDLSGVRRLDNLTLPWQDVSISTFFGLQGTLVLFDVETDPNDGDKVFVVGQGTTLENVFGIYYSPDAGVTWQIPGGSYQGNIFNSTQLQWNEVHVHDSSNIYVAGKTGYLAISNDGGATFNLATQVPPTLLAVGQNPAVYDLYSVDFCDPLIGVVGSAQNVILTIDGGVTWSITNGGNPIVGTHQIGNVVGIHYAADQQTIVACGNTAVFRSTNGGATWTQVYTWAQNNGLHMTWISDSELWIFGNGGEKAKSTDGGVTWTVITAYNVASPAQRAGHFYFNQNGFYSENAGILATNNGATTGTLSETSPYGVFAVWTNYDPPVCYVLQDCSGVAAPILANNDLSGIVGSVVQIQGSENCWTVLEGQSCQGSVTVTITATYENCDSCNPPTCYQITECTGAIAPFTTSTPAFASYVNQIVKICYDLGSTTQCFCALVEEIGECTNTTPIPQSWYIDGCVESCADCLPPPPPPLELHPRRIKPGYYTPGCPPEYTEKISCAFAEAVFDEMAIDRYGITICCDHDVDKWDLKKRILDMKAIYDPDLCKNLITPCCPPTCVEVELEVYQTMPCMPATNVEIELEVPADCLPPEYTSGTIVIEQPACLCYEVVAPGGLPTTITYTSCQGIVSNISLPPRTAQLLCSQVVPTATNGGTISLMNLSDCGGC